MKKRLVGTIVLGSLALIIIPLLLDGEGVEPLPISTTIPPAPVIDTAPIPTPVRPAIVADDPLYDPALEDPEQALLLVPPAGLDTENPTPLAEQPAPEAAPPVPGPEVAEALPQLDERGLPEAWTVRLGSFGNRANADALVDRLLTDGYKAYQRPVPSGQAMLNGVFVGPVLTRREANALQAELAMSFQLNGIVLQFELEP